MKNIITLILLQFSYMMSIAQEQSLFKIVENTKVKGETILVGTITNQELLKHKNCKWYKSGFIKYKTDSTILAELKTKINQYSFIAVIGTWCEDTQELYPQFSKTLSDCNYKLEIELIGLDRNKLGLHIENQLLQIEKVPTLIIKKGAREIGRIIESISEKNIETEILTIINSDLKNWKD